MKKNKHTINITQWKDSVLDVSEVIAESLEEAKEFIKLIFGIDIKVKIYDCFKRLVHSEIINNCEHEHHHHHHGHHGEYDGHHDHDHRGNDYR